MDLGSLFKRKPPADAAAAPDAADAVQRARTRARQRLIGAAVLVVAGIVGFPLLFESQPRPIPVELPIDIPRKDSVPPLALPSAPPETQPSVAPSPANPSPPEQVITETQADAGREVAAPSPMLSGSGAIVSAPVAARAAASSPAPRPSVPAPDAKPPGDGARALALLEGKPIVAGASAASAAATGRFVVQVGAFADAAALKEARAHVERLGLKTYTQVAETPAGPRTRVRVGPFPTRDEAERAAAKLKAAGLPAAILAL